MKYEDLLKIAANARKNADAKITGYGVGAALLSKTGTVYIGVNIEEKTIPGLSNCAERVALQNAISHGDREFVAIAIVGGFLSQEHLDDKVVPCGVCLQYLLDQCRDIDIIVLQNKDMQVKKVTDFLNTPFSLE